MRRRTFERFTKRPANLDDPLAKWELFGLEFPAPIEMVYPHSTNVIFPGSYPIDFDILELPREIADQISVVIDGGNGVPETSLTTSKPVLVEPLYYASTIMKRRQSVITKRATLGVRCPRSSDRF
jgi:hypothetical protein